MGFILLQWILSIQIIESELRLAFFMIILKLSLRFQIKKND